MKSTNKSKFKSIEVDKGGVRYRSPYTHDPYDQMTPRKGLIKAWNEECRLREAELEIYHKTFNNRS